MENEPEVSTEPDEEENHEEESVEIQHEMMDAFALPIRAKPLFHNNHEEVEEFPLSESRWPQLNIHCCW